MTTKIELYLNIVAVILWGVVLGIWTSNLIDGYHPLKVFVIIAAGIVEALRVYQLLGIIEDLIEEAHHAS